MQKPPVYDVEGYNILDPKDDLGYKSQYITLLQEKALMRYLPECDGQGIALDIGCGYGRLTNILAKKGWKVIGLDPDIKLLAYALKQNLNGYFCNGGLPDLPVPKKAASLIMLHNLLRPLLLMKQLDRFKGIRQYLTKDGKLIVVDNIRDNHQDFFTHDALVEFVESEGFKLEQRIPIRAARWWLIYLIRYGLIPKKWFDKISDYELEKQRVNATTYRWQCLNVIYIFSL